MGSIRDLINFQPPQKTLSRADAPRRHVKAEHSDQIHCFNLIPWLRCGNELALLVSGAEHRKQICKPHPPSVPRFTILFLNITDPSYLFEELFYPTRVYIITHD